MGFREGWEVWKGDWGEEEEEWEGYVGLFELGVEGRGDVEWLWDLGRWEWGFEVGRGWGI